MKDCSISKHLLTMPMADDRQGYADALAKMRCCHGEWVPAACNACRVWLAVWAQLNCAALSNLAARRLVRELWVSQQAGQTLGNGGD